MTLKNLMQIDDIILNKVSSIKKCVERAKQEHREACAVGAKEFMENFSRQDAAVLNILRACEQAIDLANHIVRLKNLGVPNEARDSFDFLVKAEVISEMLAKKLKEMIGFRNIAVHEYESVNIAIVQAVILKDIDDLLEFCAVVLS